MKSFSKRKPISSPGLAKKIVDRVGSGDALLVTSALSIYKDHPDELPCYLDQYHSRNY